jgi:hypothetical protein
MHAGSVSVKNTLGSLAVLAVGAAIVGAAVGIHYRVPIVITLVLLGLAVFSAGAGLQMIIRRQAEIPTSDSTDANREYHTGLSAQLWGILFVMFSVPIGAMGIGYWVYGDSPPAEIVQRLAGSPHVSGLIISTVGLGLVFYGLTRILPGKAGFRETGMGPVQRAMTFVYTSVVGTLVFAAGLVRAVAPGTLTRMRDAAIAWALELVK